MATEFYFPNYPYNDLREDPFLLERNNAFNAECTTYEITASVSGTYEYTDCFTNTVQGAPMTAGETILVCSLSTPTFPTGTAVPIRIGYDVFILRVLLQPLATFEPSFPFDNVFFGYTDPSGVSKQVKVFAGDSVTVQVQHTTPTPTAPTVIIATTFRYTISLSSIDSEYSINEQCYPGRLSAFETNESRYRHVLNSPETSFGQPFLGNVLKLENVMFGEGKAHFVEVKDNALYKLITKEAQEDALQSSGDIASIGATFDATAMFTAYQAYLQIYLNGITRKNYGWSYNSIASYDYYANIENGLGIKQRPLENAQYLFPGVQSVGDSININNFQRESSVFLRTDQNDPPLPFPSETPSLISGAVTLIEDRSRYVNSQKDCANPEEEFDISVVSYYASLKNVVPNQWGQMYSYETIDTGFQIIFNDPSVLAESSIKTVFGGDTFISQFSLKTKLPFFIDNRVGAPDESDIFYDEIGNVAYPEYWHSARNVLFDYKYETQPVFTNIISIKAHNFDCPNNQLPAPDSETTPPVVNPNRTFYDGKMYMFAYGIPTFYCETSINVDLRQAFNNREGDFWPHVTSGIPDDWVQESWVSIAQDNTYYYNVTYSKQNEENFFSHLPVDWEDKLCFTVFPFRAIISDIQQNFVDNGINNWLIYRPSSVFDFPQNYGKLTSLDGIQNRAVLARFENKSLLYNTLITINTSIPQAVYLGNNSLFTGAPPIDFAETDLGYMGSQHKFLLKIPQGQISVDAKRGQVFLIAGNKAQDLSALGIGLTRFLTDHLPFEILKYFPTINIDNHFNGIGLHGVYDSKYDRAIITKLDYTPLSTDVKWDSVLNEFFVETIYLGEIAPCALSGIAQSEDIPATTTSSTTPSPISIRRRVFLTDTEWFCNKSWTLSYNFNTKSWISFHSYIPNWYIAENNFFYSGLNEGCDLEIIAVQEIPATTTSSTTRFEFDCELEGFITEPISVEQGSLICETLGDASAYAILGASTVTNTGNTVITGYLGLFPGTSVTGFPPGIVVGEEHIADGEASLAQDEAEAAFVALGAIISTGSVGADIGGTTITPGVYDVGSSLGITGNVILDGLGDPNAVFIFKIPSTLITASSSSVTLTNEAQACNVYWLVGSSATLGTTTEMSGNIIANISITFTTNANLSGRAFALTGAVTLDDNTIDGCNCPPTPTTTTTTTI